MVGEQNNITDMQLMDTIHLYTYTKLIQNLKFLLNKWYVRKNALTKYKTYIAPHLLLITISHIRRSEAKHNCNQWILLQLCQAIRPSNPQSPK